MEIVQCPPDVHINVHPCQPHTHTHTHTDTEKEVFSHLWVQVSFCCSLLDSAGSLTSSADQIMPESNLINIHFLQDCHRVLHGVISFCAKQNNSYFFHNSV